MNCPHCDQPILAEDMNIQALVGKCRPCNRVFRVSDLPGDGPAANPPAARVPRPGSLVVRDDGDIRVIRRRWFRPMYVFLLFFCIAWDGFLVLWYSMGVMGGAGGDAMSLIFFVFPLAHVAVGLGLTYFVIAGFLNMSYLGVTSDGLYVRHRPVPWPGNRDLPRDEVTEIYIERGYTQTNRHRTHTQQYFNVNAVAGDGKRVKLLGGIELPEAQYCAQTLNDWLNLAPSRLGVSLNATD